MERCNGALGCSAQKPRWGEKSNKRSLLAESGFWFIGILVTYASCQLVVYAWWTPNPVPFEVYQSWQTGTCNAQGLINQQHQMVQPKAYTPQVSLGLVLATEQHTQPQRLYQINLTLTAFPTTAPALKNVCRSKLGPDPTPGSQRSSGVKRHSHRKPEKVFWMVSWMAAVID